jgi:hypothetical protein
MLLKKENITLNLEKIIQIIYMVKVVKIEFVLIVEKKISKPYALRCSACRGKFLSGKKHHSFKGGWKNNLNNCKRCGNKVKDYYSIYCLKCYRIILVQKKYSWNNIKYKNIKMRSLWEVNFAQWCDGSGIKWKYEPKTFDLGNTTYTPDFYLPEFDCWIEIKGRWMPNSKKKYNKFNKEYYSKLFDKKVLKRFGIVNY